MNKEATTETQEEVGMPENHLTAAESAVVQRYVAEINQLQNLLTVKQMALNDIAGLALDARGLSPVTHTVDAQTGNITEKSKPTK